MYDIILCPDVGKCSRLEHIPESPWCHKLLSLYILTWRSLGSFHEDQSRVGPIGVQSACMLILVYVSIFQTLCKWLIWLFLIWLLLWIRYFWNSFENEWKFHHIICMLYNLPKDQEFSYECLSICGIVKATCSMANQIWQLSLVGITCFR